MIARLDSDAIDDLREALPRFTHVPLAHLPHLNVEQRLAYWLEEISHSLARESSVAFGSSVSGRINGFIVYDDSPWDSQLTGRRVGTVQHLAATTDRRTAADILCELIDELMRSLVKRGTQCVTCRLQANELATIHALEQRDFLLMDTLLDFVFDFSRIPIREIDAPGSDTQIKIRRAKAADLQATIAVSQKAFANYFGRYHADPQMPPGTATKIYPEWVRSAFKGWADWILVAEMDDKIAGFALWRKALEAREKNSPGVANCDMVVVDPGFQGRGLGTALMLDGMGIAGDFAQYLIGPVHVCNYAVQRTLQKVGWRISGARHSFHKWLKS